MKMANTNLPSLNVNCAFSTIMGSEVCPRMGDGKTKRIKDFCPNTQRKDIVRSRI